MCVYVCMCVHAILSYAQLINFNYGFFQTSNHALTCRKKHVHMPDPSHFELEVVSICMAVFLLCLAISVALAVLVSSVYLEVAASVD